VRQDPEQRGEIEAALLRRAEAAIRAAERVRARSEVVVAVSAATRGPGIVTRCAWCGRYRFGDQWVVVAEVPHFGEFEDVTHGICEDCVEKLRAAGLSA